MDIAEMPLARLNDEPPSLAAPEGEEARTLELQADPQRSQDRLVEPPAGRQVPRPQGDVVYRWPADGGFEGPLPPAPEPDPGVGGG